MKGKDCDKSPKIKSIKGNAFIKISWIKKAIALILAEGIDFSNRSSITVLTGVSNG